MTTLRAQRLGKTSPRCHYCGCPINASEDLYGLCTDCTNHLVERVVADNPPRRAWELAIEACLRLADGKNFGGLVAITELERLGYRIATDSERGTATLERCKAEGVRDQAC